jgi:hypothetical protein
MPAPTNQARPMSRIPHGYGAARQVLRAGPLLVGVVLLVSPALGQAPVLPPNPARLDYSRPDGLEVCPEEFYFRAVVAGQLGGVDPFTAKAPKRITVTLLPLKSGAFMVKLDMYNQAGALLGSNKPDLRGSNCVSLVENAGGVVASWLVPLVGPAPAPKPSQAEPPAVPPPSPPPTIQPAPTRPQAASPAPPPVALSRPSVFGGPAGYVRALLVGLSAGGLGTGIASLAVADSRKDAARDLLGTLQQKGGSSPCLRNAFAGSCQQVLELFQQQDNFATLAAVSFVAAGLTAATASIWIARTPSALSVQVMPSAPGSRVGLTLKGSL